MGIRDHIDIAAMKTLSNGIWDSIDSLNEFGYASHPSEFNEKYKMQGQKIVKLLTEANAILDELCDESTENFEY